MDGPDFDDDGVVKIGWPFTIALCLVAWAVILAPAIILILVRT